MDKETLLTEFGSRLGKTDSEGNYTQAGISSRTLDVYVENILPTAGEAPDENFYTSHVAILNSLGGQMRKQIADAIKSAMPKQTPPSIDEADKAQTPPSDEVQKLQATIESLTKRLDDQDKTRLQETSLSELKTLLKEKGATDEYVLRNTLKGYVIPEGKNPEEVVDAVLSLYDKEVRECRGDGATPRNGSGGKNSQTAVNNYFARKAQREGWNKNK